MSAPTRAIIQAPQPAAVPAYPSVTNVATLDKGDHLVGPFKTTKRDDGYNDVSLDADALKPIIQGLGFALAGSTSTGTSTTPTTTAPAVYVTATQALTQMDTYSANQLNLNSTQNSIRIKAVIDASQAGYTNARWVKLTSPANDTSKFANLDPTILDTYIIDMIAGTYQYRFEFTDTGGMVRQGVILTTIVAAPAATTPPASSGGTAVANANFKIDVFGRRDQQATSTEVTSPLTILTNEDAAKLRVVLSNVATVNGSAGPVKLNYSFPSASGPAFNGFGPVAEQSNLLEVTVLYLPIGNTRVRVVGTDAANTVFSVDFIITRAAS